MPVKIENIMPDSLAEESGILPGERIISINGNPVRDFLDLQYYSAEDELLLEVKKLNGEIITQLLRNNWEKPLGFIAEDHKCRECINNCIFCFIDQMPPQNRDSLYIKDDDICFSFYYGNFVTLTNLSSRDYHKIIEQRLSPLYISVHTTNQKLHKKMLRYKRDFDIVERLYFLADNDIAFHTQIVVVPGYNDKEELQRTLKELDQLNDNCLSIGIVPVGITKFRDSLTKLRTVTPEEAKLLLMEADKYPRTWCSDEIYLKAGRQLPDFDSYEGFEQLENGIGMLRMTLANWEENKEEFIEQLQKLKKDPVFVSGILAADYIRDIASDISENCAFQARVQEVTNHFLGQTVTVTGLLSWQDIHKQLNLAENEIAVFSSSTFNTEGYTLDGKHQTEIAAICGGEIIIIQEQFTDWDLISSK